MSFFDTTPQGRILNRFSKDTSTIDSEVPANASQALQGFFMVVGMIISIACVNWPCLIVIIPAIIIFMYIYSLFRKVYPHVTRIEAIARSPVLNICTETVDCLITIRSFG